MTNHDAPVRKTTGRTRRAQQKEFAMCFAVSHLAIKRAERQVAVSSVDRDIRDFLAGRTDGEELLHALYDHVLDEPVPERLRALVR